MAQSPRRRRGIGPWERGFVFSGSFCDRSRDAVHGAVSRHRAWLCLHSIGNRYSGDVCLDRLRNESALFLVKRTARLAQIPAETGPMDVTGETADGLSADRNVALFALRARCATWRRHPHLDVRISASAQRGVLVERRVRHANFLRENQRLHAPDHAPAYNINRVLIHYY